MADEQTTSEAETVEQLTTRNAELEADVEGLGLKVDELRGQRDDEKARADKAEAALTKAKAKVSKGDTPAKPRKLGMPSDPADIDRDKLREAIATADKVEIAFSDGRQEITALPPLVVEGAAWRDHAALGLMLREPQTLHGPATGQPSVQIDGYALLLDGKQVAYTRRSDKLNLAAGQTVSLADDIYFG